MSATSSIVPTQSALVEELPVLPSLTGTVGTYTIGTFVSLILYGVSCLQFYRYRRLYPADHAFLKALVVMLIIAPMHTCYHYLVTNFANPRVMQNGVWSLNIQPVMSGIISLLAFSFCARRVSLIGVKSRIVALTSISLLLASNAVTTRAFQLKTFLRFGEQSKGITGASLALAASADYLLAAALITVMLRDQADHSRASLMEVAITYILNTGLLTGTLQWLAAIMSLRFPLKLYWATLGLITLKFRAITLLSVLNTRKTMASRGITVFNSSMYARNAIARAHRLTTMERFNVPRDPREDGPSVISIKVAAETEVHGGRSHESSITYIHDNISKAEC
ncbi:hypothetical protein C8Q73DRAFT_785120 [Cubamyces lactineus]|nr:hypothetical protein C8Q73DRAFT_785120 [Cubamyces lactineus]